MIKNTKDTITRNMPTPAFVLVICVTDASSDEALPIRSDTSSVRPLVMILADCVEISENSPLEILKAKVNNPITKDMTPRISTALAMVRTKSFAVKGNMVYLQNRLFIL
jgi:hypothetical protein